MIKYSVIIPVFNRPEELRDLLESLYAQTVKNFEVIVIEDGSQNKSDKVVAGFKDKLDIKYFYQSNTGPGPARNAGCSQASSDYFIFFDSDCLIPEHYFGKLDEYMSLVSFDAFGGPDKANFSFTRIQQAINYSMTSFFTTGGIRGSKKSLEKFHPRSFNMGFSRNVYEATGGFSNMRFGEDIDLSIRIKKEGFGTALLSDCFVYHKRRVGFLKFFKQVFNSGIARINLYKRHPSSLKAIHFLPALFTLYLIFGTAHALYHHQWWILYPMFLYLIILWIDATMKTSDLLTGLLSIFASVWQLIGYGLGFMKGFWRRIILGKGEFHAFDKNFYD